MDESDEFAARHLRALGSLPSPCPRAVLYLLLAAITTVAAGITFGRVDVVAVAPGKLVPQSLLKVVQPTDSGVVREIRVREGQAVAGGDVLFRMDTALTEADLRIVESEMALRRLQLRRIEAELTGSAFALRGDDPPELVVQVQAQFNARQRAFQDALDAERSAQAKAREDLKAAEEIEAKLRRTAPIYREQERAWEQLAREGFAGKLLALERSRSRIENEQDLHAQAAAVSGAKAAIALSERRMAQLESNHRRELSGERVEMLAQLERLQEDYAKQNHRSRQLELRAPAAGIVKDLATHSAGTVVAPGTILATIVPRDEPLEAEVWVSNIDAARVLPGAAVKLKLAAFPFQHYGMLGGVVRHVSADATERSEANGAGHAATVLHFRALISIERGTRAAPLTSAKLASGMQLAAEVHLGTRSVLDYLLSPVRKTLSEAGREL
ncbi:MAG: HlyD family type I secretion periplasmic adaptor subunit [Burkholderiales bacterium]|nr:HlyD family type I secretion periplasmic adaptor subunit [Burkholderiales bacterium]